MAKLDNLPFPIGTTFFEGQTADTTTKEAINLEGKEYTIEDVFHSSSTFSATKTLRSAQLKRVRIVRNVSAIALLPRRLAILQVAGADGRYHLGRVDGMCHLGEAGNPQQCFPIDEFLPSAGCPANDLFYITIEGPAEILTSLAGSTAENTFSVGSILVSATAASSQATTSGRLSVQVLATTGATLGNNIQNRIGRALSAMTSSNTNTAALVWVTKL